MILNIHTYIHLFGLIDFDLSLEDPSAIPDNLALAYGHHVWPLAAAQVRLHAELVASLGPAKLELLLLQAKSWKGDTGLELSPRPLQVDPHPPSFILKESSKDCVSGCELMSWKMDIASSSSPWPVLLRLSTEWQLKSGALKKYHPEVVRDRKIIPPNEYSLSTLLGGKGVGRIGGLPKDSPSKICGQEVQKIYLALWGLECSISQNHETD